MRTTLEQLRSIRLSSLTAATLAGVAGFALVGCQSDSPTGLQPDSEANVPAVAFPLAPGAANAAVSSTRRLVRTLPTVALAGAARSHVSPSNATVNSPFDLTFSGGPVVTSATSHNVYVNCSSGPTTCWGTGTLSPATFLRDLNVSSLIQVADQYLDEDAAGRFAVAEMKTTATFANHTASLNDIYSILFSASTFAHASGYHNIFHVFLPKGTDMCTDATDCYSPDNLTTFTFCAFHGSVDFGPNQHVLFSVQPYQAVTGCTLPTQTRVIDATASSLSHEFFEAITDPDLDAWYSLLTGNEVADLCFGFRNGTRVGSRTYTVQEEYSNTIHDCTNGAY